MTTSQKHSNFIQEPMGYKPVDALPGIGEVLGNRLKDEGYDKAYVVLGQYFLLKCNEEMFKEWLQNLVKANSKQSDDCYKALRDWCKSNFF